MTDKDEKNTFVMYDVSSGNLVESGKFKGKFANQAAKKVATKGFKNFALRKVGTSKISIYEGSMEKRTIVAPKMAEWQEKKAIKEKSYCDGKPCLEVKVGVAKFIKPKIEIDARPGAIDGMSLSEIGL